MRDVTSRLSGVEKCRLKPLCLSVCLSVLLPGLVHVGDELREVNGVSVIHKRPDEISQLLVRPAFHRKTLKRIVDSLNCSLVLLLLEQMLIIHDSDPKTPTCTMML